MHAFCSKFKALKTINEDVIGWIRVDGTGINYPILQGGDNDYYLARNYKKEFNTIGKVDRSTKKTKSVNPYWCQLLKMMKRNKDS